MKKSAWITLIALLWGATLSAQTDDGGRLELPQSIASVSGTLIDKETGEPASICRVELHSKRPSNSADLSLTSHILSATYSSSQGLFTITIPYYFKGLEYSIEIHDPKYQFEMQTDSVSEGDNDWGVIELSQRPFYFENTTQKGNVVSTTVVNTTKKRAYMRFWLTGQLTRLDDSIYFGCNATTLLKLKNRRKGDKTYATYRLAPGENPLKLTLKDYGPDIVISRIQMNGGRSSSEPMMSSVNVAPYLSPFYWDGELISFTNSIIIATNFPTYPTNPPPILIPYPFPTNPPPILTPFPFPTNPPPWIIDPFPTNVVPINPVLPPYTILPLPPILTNTHSRPTRTSSLSGLDSTDK